MVFDAKTMLSALDPDWHEEVHTLFGLDSEFEIHMREVIDMFTLHLNRAIIQARMHGKTDIAREDALIKTAFGMLDQFVRPITEGEKLCSAYQVGYMIGKMEADLQAAIDAAFERQMIIDEVNQINTFYGRDNATA